VADVNAMAQHPEGEWTPEDEQELLQLSNDEQYRAVRALDIFLLFCSSCPRNQTDALHAWAGGGPSRAGAAAVLVPRGAV
jgi:hypothetical protein